MWAVNNGVFAAENGSFYPERGITREEAALILERYTGEKISFEKQGALTRAGVAEIFFELSCRVGG